MTFSKHYLEHKMAWVIPQFLTSQLEETNAKRSIGGLATTLEKPSSAENQTPAQTTTSPTTPKVSDRFELNDLENKLKAAEVINAQLRQTNNSLEEQNKGLSSDLEKNNNKINLLKKHIEKLNNKYNQKAKELSQANFSISYFFFFFFYFCLFFVKLGQKRLC